MSRDHDGTAELERRLQALLTESVQRVDGRARSRLNRARHAALAEAARPRRWYGYGPRRLAARAGRRLLWMPAAGALAAALLVAIVLWPHPRTAYPAVQARHAEDLELLADREGMDLMQSGDGQFYEWAMVQAGKDGPAAGSGAPAAGKGGGAQGSGADTGQNNG
jgi:hypothetical protein